MATNNGKFAPEHKKPGDLILSDEWNAGMQEAVRLESAKVNRKGGDSLEGPLTIASALAVDKNATNVQLEVKGALKLADGVAVNQFSSDASLGTNSDSIVPTQKAVKTYVDEAVKGSENVDFQAKDLRINGKLTAVSDITATGSLKFARGLAVNEFSSEVLFTANSDSIVPTQKAVKTYVDESVKGRANLDFQAKDLAINGKLTAAGITASGSLKFASGVAVNEFSNEVLLGANSDSIVPTQKAVKTYVDRAVTNLDTTVTNAINTSVKGSENQDFKAKDLRVYGKLTVDGDVISKNIQKMEGNVELGNEDTDIITVFGTISSRHSSGFLQVNAPLSVTQNLIVNGNVGIGTTSPPSYPLEVTTTGNWGIAHTRKRVTLSTYIDDDSAWIGTKTNHPLHFYTNNSASKMTLDTSQFDVNCDLKVGGVLKLGNSWEIRYDNNHLSFWANTYEVMKLGLFYNGIYTDLYLKNDKIMNQVSVNK